MYKVIVENRAVKETKSLPNDIIQSLINIIEDLKLNPRPHGVKKLAGDVGWRLRIRDYRILYTINDSARVVSIYRVKHRREVYR